MGGGVRWSPRSLLHGLHHHPTRGCPCALIRPTDPLRNAPQSTLPPRGPSLRRPSTTSGGRACARPTTPPAPPATRCATASPEASAPKNTRYECLPPRPPRRLDEGRGGGMCDARATNRRGCGTRCTGCCAVCCRALVNLTRPRPLPATMNMHTHSLRDPSSTGRSPPRRRPPSRAMCSFLRAPRTTSTATCTTAATAATTSCATPPPEPSVERPLGGGLKSSRKQRPRQGGGRLLHNRGAANELTDPGSLTSCLRRASASCPHADHIAIDDTIIFLTPGWVGGWVV